MDIEIDIAIDTILTQLEELLDSAEKIRLLSEPLASVDPTIK